MITSTAGGKRPYRIGFVSDGVYPFNKGGKERRLWEISRRLVAGGIEVHIYTMKWWTGGKVLNLGGVQLHAICKRRSLYHGEQRSMFQAVLFGLATLKLLVARFDVLDVDHMPYFPLFSAQIVCALRRKRMVATWHEVWGNEYWRRYLGRLAPISAAIERLSARTPDAIVAVSPQTSRRLTSDLGVTVPVHTIELGVDLEAIRAQEKSYLCSDILFAGRLLAHKNVDVLLRAVALLTEKFPRLRCRIVGEGPERLQLEALSAELGLTDHVVFHDFFPGTEIYGVMKSATVFALAATWNEIVAGQAHLEGITSWQATSFCYPGGAFRPEHVRLVREAGFSYARTVRRFSLDAGSDPLRSPTTVQAYHHMVGVGPLAHARLRPVAAWSLYRHWDRLAMHLFDQVIKVGGLFHLWGYSWEVAGRSQWGDLQRVCEYIAGRPGVRYLDNGAITKTRGDAI